MSRHRAPRRPGLAVVRLSLALAAVAGGLVALVSPDGGFPAPAPAAGPPPVTVGATAAQAQAAPTRVRIPSLGVDSALDPLGTDAAGALVPPGDFHRAGWFTGGAAPGEVGPAVIAGHVDSYAGPAVFARLGELAPGDVVLVDRVDGTAMRFTVTRSDRYAKDDFPTEEVYGPTPRAELRLITCGGDFDRELRSYVDNVVVYATVAGDGRVA